MTSEYRWEDTANELQELRRHDQVLASLQHMLSCRRRGLCLLKEWLRRYGNPGSGCSCFNRFQEHISEQDLSDDD